jgi:hypothetical protein
MVLKHLKHPGQEACHSPVTRLPHESAHGLCLWCEEICILVPQKLDCWALEHHVLLITDSVTSAAGASALMPGNAMLAPQFNW